MSHIVIITNIHDDFLRRKFLLRSLSKHWIDAGHQVSVVAGLGRWPDADIAILHVDLTVIPEVYCQAARQYPLVVNMRAADIRKSRYCRHTIQQGDDWPGPVIVKTDLNCGGVPELRARHLARQRGEETEAGLPVGRLDVISGPYPIYNCVDDVPANVWESPGLFVERFLPERDPENGYWMRAWVFFGDRERCNRYRGTHPIVKGRAIVAQMPASVPDELRAERERLGFDYGKFDFVVHNDEVILFDANRTPYAPPSGTKVDVTNAELAKGLDKIVRSRA